MTPLQITQEIEMTSYETRLADATRNEAERTRLYDALIAAQLAARAAAQAHVEAAYAARIAQETLDDFLEETGEIGDR